MRTLDEDHPEMQKAARELHAAVNKLCTGKQIDNRLMIDLNNLLYHHRSKWRMQGLDFPRMCAMIVPPNILELNRADLDGEAIEARILRFVREHPETTAEQVAQAVRWAWPQYSPKDAAARVAEQRAKSPWAQNAGEEDAGA